MHVRLSTCLGVPFVEEGSDETLGVLSGILIHPDTAKVEGFFVRSSSFLRGEDLFVSALDILRWGRAILVSDREAIAAIEDRIRLQPLLEDGRALLGQRMQTESGRKLGTCADVQFDTVHFLVEWLFPRRWFKWGIAVPVSDILEVRKEAIIVREPQVPVTKPAEDLAVFEPMQEAV
ncbi:MAG: hypothetical protein Q7R81_00445 [Candidatus Peregrinibacteria bacterium]|nr:hypothetical protein [Candidatus Peregrinibacteria bacterium]